VVKSGGDTPIGETPIRRGAVWWTELPEPSGSEPGYRPVLIVQTDDFNKSRIGTVVAVVITSHLLLAEAPGNVFLPARETGLPRDSVANVSQIVTLDRQMLVKEERRVHSETMRIVETGLRLVLALQA
jgi:mRNA interferase MazF